ncbi:hypothetical protein [Phocaeicola plebeius]|uniref:hypothetical protein n=1 Tax=Phocaeicola plebeius TaxID=310297 RepID=UPI0026EC4952|nr:hypothetical protein [Phocaeicola plebeius]
MAKGQQNVMIFDERRNIPMNSLAVRKNDTKNVVAFMNVVVFIAIASLAAFAAVLVSANPAFAAQGISTLFGEAGKIAEAVMTGFQGLVLTVAIAAGVYTMIRGLMASDPKETAQYKSRFIAIVIIAFVAFFTPSIIRWVQTLATQIKLS